MEGEDVTIIWVPKSPVLYALVGYPYSKLVPERTSVKSTVFFYLARLLLLCTFSHTGYHRFHHFIFFLCFDGFVENSYIFILASRNIDPIGASLILNLGRRKPKLDADSMTFVV